MAKFMLIAGGIDIDKRSGNPAFHGPIFERYVAWVQGLTKAGTMLGSFKLHDQIGTRLTVRGGEVVDGPFVETKEAIGGAFLIEAESLAQATEIGRGCPVFAQNGWLEVRPVER
jgi:hypothetical protein